MCQADPLPGFLENETSFMAYRGQLVVLSVDGFRSPSTLRRALRLEGEALAAISPL
jgi:hypothetical protein